MYNHEKKIETYSFKFVLPSNKTLDILRIGVGTQNFHVSYTWYKSLESENVESTCVNRLRARVMSFRYFIELITILEF